MFNTWFTFTVEWKTQKKLSLKTEINIENRLKILFRELYGKELLIAVIKLHKMSR